MTVATSERVAPSTRFPSVSFIASLLLALGVLATSALSWSLRQQLETSSALLAATQSNLGQTQQQLTALGQERDGLAEQADQLNAQVAQVTQERDQATADLATANDGLARLGQQLRATQDQLGSTSQQRDSLAQAGTLLAQATQALLDYSAVADQQIADLLAANNAGAAGDRATQHAHIAAYNDRLGLYQQRRAAARDAFSKLAAFLQGAPSRATSAGSEPRVARAAAGNVTA